MTVGAWRYAYASATGTAHGRVGLPCQDAGACEVLVTAAAEAVLIAVAADGAGSAARAEVGAQLACARAVEELEAHFAGGGSVDGLTRAAMHRLLTGIQHEIAARAAVEGLAARHFACTLLLAVVGAEAAMFLQVGDGAIVTLDPRASDTYCWIFWPQRGEYENTTTFVTEPAALAGFHHELAPRAFDEIALFTDGLQRLALHLATQAAYDPFFRPMFRALRPASRGYQLNLSSTLAEFLASPRVTARTDDDTTLILATRAAPPARSIADCAGAVA